VIVAATKNKHVHFSARLRELAAYHNAGIGMDVVIHLNQLSRRQCLCFSRFIWKAMEKVVK